MEPKIINIFDTVGGENCVTLDDGEKVFAILRDALSKKIEVKTDFRDVTVFATPFFNAAFGQLLGEFSSEFLNTHLKIVNLSQNGIEVAKRVIKNSKDYYANPENKKAVSEAIRRRSQE